MPWSLELMPAGDAALPKARAFNADTLRAAPRELRTARLVMQAPSVDHAVALAAFFNASLPDWPFIGWPKFWRDVAWAERFCARGLRYVEDGENLIFNVFETPPAGEPPGACIGRIDLHSFDFDTPRCEIGYVGDPRVSGRGLLREAVLAVVDLGFRLGLVRIEAFSDVRNHRALHFATGIGFQREGLVRHRERDPEGALCDQVMLARLATDGVRIP